MIDELEDDVTDVQRSFLDRALSSLQNAASELLERSKLASAMGATFGGARKIWEVLGYKKQLSSDDYRLAYERGDIAAAIVDAKPNATWRAGAELIENDDSDVETPFEKAWVLFERRLKIWSVFHRADRLAGIGEYAIVLVGAPGSLETPMPLKLKPEEIVFLKPYSDQEAKINEGDWDTNTNSERFGKPNFYTISKKSRVRGFSSGEKKVHWSRVIHVTDGLLDDDFYGYPRLQRVWNKLDDLMKVVGGGSEAFWLLATPLRQYDVDPKVPIKPGQKEKMEAEIEEVENKLRRSLRTRGVTIADFSSSPANFAPQQESILQIIAGAAEIPVRILLGSERGELASTQDRSNWADRITDRRNLFAEPYVVRPFVDQMIAAGALPTPLEWKVRWPEIAYLTDGEKADKAVKWATVNRTMGREVYGGNEIRDLCTGLPKKDELDEVMDPLEQFGSKQREDSDAEDEEKPAKPGKTSKKPAKPTKTAIEGGDDLPIRPADSVSDEDDLAQQELARQELARAS